MLRAVFVPRNRQFAPLPVRMTRSVSALLVRVATASVPSFAIVCLVMGIVSSLRGSLHYGILSPSLRDEAARGLAFAVIAFMLGIAVVLLWGVPAYSVAVRVGKATALTALMIGVAPGATLVALRAPSGSICLIYGAMTALLAHYAFNYLDRRSNDRDARAPRH